MEERDKDPLPFCARPPLCLSLLGDGTKDDDRAFAEEAREIQRRLREQLSQFWTEFGLFARLMYKNKNQHRRCLYYRRLAQVRRDLEMLNRSELRVVVEKLTTFSVVSGEETPKPTQRFQPALKMDAGKSLSTLLGCARLLNQVDEPILAASAELAGLLGQTFFMPFALTMFSCLARFRALLMQILYEIISAFNLLSAMWHRNHKESMRVLEQHFPASLECQWNGSRLSITENRAASFLDQGRADNDQGQGAPLYVVDDRTGVHFDIGTSNAGREVGRHTTLELGELSSMTKDINMDANGTATDLIIPAVNFSDPVPDHPEMSLPSAAGWTIREEISRGAVDTGVTGLVLSNPLTAIGPSFDVSEKLATDSPAIAEREAEEARTLEPLARDEGVSQNKVAYTSVSHKFTSVPNMGQLFQSRYMGRITTAAVNPSIESSLNIKAGERSALSNNVPYARDGSNPQNKVAYTSVFHKFGSISNVRQKSQQEFQRSDEGGQGSLDATASMGSDVKDDVKMMDHREPGTSDVLDKHEVHLRSSIQSSFFTVPTNEGSGIPSMLGTEKTKTGLDEEIHSLDDGRNSAAPTCPESRDVTKDYTGPTDMATTEQLGVANSAGIGELSAVSTGDRSTSLESIEGIQDKEISNADAAALKYDSRSCSEALAMSEEPGVVDEKWVSRDDSALAAHGTVQLDFSPQDLASPLLSSPLRESRFPDYSTGSSSEAPTEAVTNTSGPGTNVLELGAGATDDAVAWAPKQDYVSNKTVDVQVELANFVVPVAFTDTKTSPQTSPVESPGRTSMVDVKDVIDSRHASVKELSKEATDVFKLADLQSKPLSTLQADVPTGIKDELLRKAAPVEGLSHDIKASKQTLRASEPIKIEDEQAGIPSTNIQMKYESAKKKGSKRRRSNKGKAGSGNKRLKDEGDATRKPDIDKINGTGSSGDKESKKKATNDIFAMLLGGLD